MAPAKTDKTPAEMLDALGKPFPRTAIKQRKGGGGKSLSYIETHTVIHRLNTATNGWDFHIRGYDWRGDLLMVHGELTIPGLGTRSGFGVQQVVERAGEDLVKGAASDCLKKCATLFGVALDLYGADYEANMPVERATTAPNAPKAPAPSPNTLDREKVLRALHATGKDAGFEHIDLHNLIVAKGHESMSTAPVEALVDLGKAIKADPAKLRAWLAKQAELMPSETDVPNPDRFTA